MLLSELNPAHDLTFSHSATIAVMLAGINLLFADAAMATVTIAADTLQFSLSATSSSAGCCSVQVSDSLSHGERVKTLSHRQCWSASMRVALKRGSSMRSPTAAGVVLLQLKDEQRVPKRDDALKLCCLWRCLTMHQLHLLQQVQDDDENHHLTASSRMELERLPLVDCKRRTKVRPGPSLKKALY